ncbi:unnamed protein product [Symbiodinium pilosum]|uniref:Uncharacterized protein n=1 Tax=Symbiodinium pilosum TaxID=2952 RepID=A0A812RMU1_SYMPI|nr:unnamed protein product [Symbiodinium pilosum]
MPRFREQEVRIEKVVTQLASETTARQSAVVAKLEGAVLDHLPETNFQAQATLEMPNAIPPLGGDAEVTVSTGHALFLPKTKYRTGNSLDPSNPATPTVSREKSKKRKSIFHAVHGSEWL